MSSEAEGAGEGSKVGDGMLVVSYYLVYFFMPISEDSGVTGYILGVQNFVRNAIQVIRIESQGCSEGEL